MAEPHLAGYALEARLAVGGMAEVFRARRLGPAGFTRLVALKRVLPDLARDPELVRMFLDEARLAARCSCPNLVQVFDFGEQDGSYYMVMELIEGGDLAGALARGGPLAPDAAVQLGQDLCCALGHLHALADEQGRALEVVHRDVNPANVLLTRAGDVKLGDLGVARVRARALRTASGTVKGKLAYLSPEQARGEPVDARADLYGLGLVLFEALAGERFLRGDDEAALLREAQQPRWRSLAALRPGLPLALEEVARRALQPEPAQRFPSALLMAEALRRALPALDVARAREQLRQRALAAASGPISGSAVADRPSDADPALAPARASAAPATELYQVPGRNHGARSRAWILAGTLGVTSLAAAGSLWWQRRADAPPPPITVPITATSASGGRDAGAVSRPIAVDAAPTRADLSAIGAPHRPRAAPPPSRPLLPPEAPDARIADASPAADAGQRTGGPTAAPADASAAVAIDQAYVDARLRRLDQRLAARALSPATQQEVQRLTRAALSATVRGRYREANEKLDQIEALLD